MYRHILNASFSEQPERLLIDRLLFKFIQCFQAVDDSVWGGGE